MTEINTGTAVMTDNEATEETTRTSNAQFEMTEQLSRKMHITLEEAKAALEASDWNLLTATYFVEQEEFKRKQLLNEVAAAEAPDEQSCPEQNVSDNHTTEKAEEKSKMKENGLKKVGRAIMNLIAIGNRNRFAIHKGSDQLLDMPVTVLALLLLFSFGTCAFLLVVGLFAGCRYSINGKDFSTAEV